MVFVTVKHVVSTVRGAAIEEEQDIVYLPMPKTFAPPAPVPLPEDVSWRRPWPLDPVLLFRFSAITFNAHRIHYDRTYAVEVEKYPGLVVHGPMQALMLFEEAKARHPGRRIAAYSFRGVRPLFDFDRAEIVGREREDGIDLFTADGDGLINMQANLTWASGPA
ncbi:MAG: protein dehydratase, partial [Parvibaculaceae bacterium]